MADSDTVEMDADSIDEFLQRGGTGVLSVSTASDQPPYSLPVSYGYDPEERVLYFRLGFEADSGKGQFITDGRPVSFITSVHGESRWQSAVATGTLEAVGRPAADSNVATGLQRVEIPLVDMFDRPTRAVAFEFFRLDPDTLTGRREA